jgi:DNA-binding transcriptional LysR family regulator
MDALTLDQFAVFAAVVDEGSFAGAARRMNRAQSAITYAIQKLEDQTGVELFDRSAYRPALTESGTALLPRARRILAELDEYRLHARRMTQGLEDELSLIVHPYVPPEQLASMLSAFHKEFPSVRINTNLGARDTAVDGLRSGKADLALVPEVVSIGEDLERRSCGPMEVVLAAAPNHPLAQIDGVFPVELLRSHMRLAMTGVLSEEENSVIHTWGFDGLDVWRVMDFRIFRELLLAGVGWGTVARFRVADDIAQSRLIVLRPEAWGDTGYAIKIPLLILRSANRPPGPAGRWLFDQFSTIGFGRTDGNCLSQIIVDELSPIEAAIGDEAQGPPPAASGKQRRERVRRQ